MGPREQKRLLRRTMVDAILATDPGERQSQNRILAERFPDLPGFDRAGTVLLYITAFPEEIDTRPMIAAAAHRGKRLVFPRVDRAARRLVLFEVESLERDFVPGVLGIPEPRMDCPTVEPDEIDWVLVPGLAFDQQRYRLGRGAGHYDRLLPMLGKDVPRWALAFDCQWVDALPVESHDVALDGVVSPSRTAGNQGAW